MKVIWETVAREDFNVTHRMKVPGGWVVRSYIKNQEDYPVALVFVPDVKHEWMLEK